MASNSSSGTSEKPILFTTSNGVAVPAHPYSAQTAGPGGPLLLQDFNLLDSLSHFDFERIPERVVHANGHVFHGYYECTDSLSDITTAEIFQDPGYKCSVSIRFSTVGGEHGTPDTLRDPRGFAIKFRTSKSGAVYDLVANNTPVFFIRDPLKFPHFIHSQKRDPRTHLNHLADSTRYWDYLTQNPESIHQITYMFGDRGTPADFGAMHGYSGHTFKFVNHSGDFVYVQIHVLAEEGFKTLSSEEAEKLNGASPDYNLAKMFARIENGNYPEYGVYVQTMTQEQAENFRYSVNDLTKVWPHKEFPLRKTGKIVLNKNVENYFAETEQIAFSPSHLIPGIEPSNDPVLQSRLFSYSDTARHRLGVNYQQLPVNRPPIFDKASACPFAAGNFQRDGPATYYNQGRRQDYISTYNDIHYLETKPDQKEPFNYVENKYKGVVTKQAEDKSIEVQKHEAQRKHEFALWQKHSVYISGISELDLEQPRALYEKVYSDSDKKNFINHVVSHASTISDDGLKQRIAQYFGLLTPDLGKQIAKGLGVNFENIGLAEYARKVGIASA